MKHDRTVLNGKTVVEDDEQYARMPWWQKCEYMIGSFIFVAVVGLILWLGSKI